jgi:hypothetical protein
LQRKSNPQKKSDQTEFFRSLFSRRTATQLQLRLKQSPFR